MIQKGISQNSIPNPKYILQERKQPVQGTVLVVQIWKLNLQLPAYYTHAEPDYDKFGGSFSGK
jgi:hypothetical protein